MTKTEQLFNEATKTIQSRGLVYGHPFYNMERISKLVSSYLEHPVMPHDICIINILQKISRLQESPGHYDSLVDIAAYINIYKTVYDAETDIDFKKGDDL
jgi:hypothetical protein